MKLAIKLLILACSLSVPALAQYTRKPSPTREPKGVMNKKPDSKKRYLSEIGSRKDFDLMARVYHQKTPYALPHAMFIIDRKKNNRIYYINSQKYRFHKDFLIGNYLVLKGEDLFNNIYIKENRRFIVGTIAWQSTVGKFTFEYWEGDMVPADQIKTTHDVINSSFYEKVSFKPNSNRHEELSAKLGIPIVTSSEISKNQEYLALNTATGVGRLHIIDKLDDTVEIGYNEILVLKEVPISLPPVRGIIVTKPSTPLSHVNLLAKGWGIPNAYIKDADKLFKEFDTWWVKFETTLTDYKIVRADKRILDEEKKRREALGEVIRTPESDLSVKDLALLRKTKKSQSISYGAKAANLGEIAGAGMRGISVPNGFSIPFYNYDEFMKKHGFYEEMKDLRDDLDFVHNPRYRRQKLKEFREKIQAAKFDPELRKKILQMWKTEASGLGLFVRSSSNAEDLPDFSGAGLYETVANVKQPDAIIEAVKTVWGSLWNFEAYEARERNFISHEGTYMGVLMQIGVKTESSGVMITKDPFDAENKGAIYISAKRGLGIKVVDGKKIAEQILYRRSSNAIQVLTRSAEETLLTFDEKGGVKEVPIDGERNVLTDEVSRRLVTAANKIKRLFGNRVHQDIEWGYAAGQIYIFQARPFIDNS
ncbi:MAG: pyruvate, phosphate dikinase [Pyrinomonadaceae bacterium]|nr:pyruvate, phosphate dikinase [Pyrinomonadaceae bacterium]